LSGGFNPNSLPQNGASRGQKGALPNESQPGLIVPVSGMKAALSFSESAQA
jgi:hypothetical protein